MVVHSETKTVGICAFTNDANVEYYVEDLPKDVVDKGKEVIASAVMTGAMAVWNTKWVYAEEVNLLLQDETIVRYLDAQRMYQQDFFMVLLVALLLLLVLLVALLLVLSLLLLSPLLLLSLLVPLLLLQPSKLTCSDTFITEH